MRVVEQQLQGVEHQLYLVVLEEVEMRAMQVQLTPEEEEVQEILGVQE